MELIIFGLISIFVLFLVYIIEYKKPDRGSFRINFDGQTFSLLIFKNKIMLSLKNTQKVTGTLAPLDAKGNDAPIETGSVVVSSSDEAVATIEKDPENEKSLTVKGVNNGTCTLTISADADLGEGVKTITTEVNVEIISGQASNFGITFGEPVEQ